MFLKVGIRADKVSLARAEAVIRLVQHAHHDVQVERKIFIESEGIHTDTLRRRKTASRVKQSPEYGLLNAVSAQKIDFGVLNMKDLPWLELEDPIVLAATPERGSPYDALITRDGSGLKTLKPRSLVGASTLLRIIQLRKARPDLKVEPVGGRVEDRIARIDNGSLDGVIIAESGLARLGMSGRIAERLPVDVFMPAPGQGVTAVVCRRDNKRVASILKSADNSRTRTEAETERELLRLFTTQCNIPIGVYASVKGDTLQVMACVMSADGSETLRTMMTGPASQSIDFARKAAESLISQGAGRFEDGWRKTYPLYDD